MRRHSYRTVKWKISLPASLAARVELRLPINSGQACPAYGVRSKLIEDLLTDWVDAIEREATTVTLEGAVYDLSNS